MSTEHTRMIRAAGSTYGVSLLREIYENKNFRWRNISFMPDKLNMGHDLQDLIKSGLVEPIKSKYSMRNQGYKVTSKGLKVLNISEKVETFSEENRILV